MACGFPRPPPEALAELHGRRSSSPVPSSIPTRHVNSSTRQKVRRREREHDAAAEERGGPQPDARGRPPAGAAAPKVGDR